MWPALVTGFKQPPLHHFHHATPYTTALLVYPFWQLVHCNELLSTPLLQTPHGHVTAFCLTFWRSSLHLGFIHIDSHAFALHVTFPLIKPFHLLIFSFSYHCQVIDRSICDRSILQISNSHVTAISHCDMIIHYCKLEQLMSVNMQCITAVLIIKVATVSKSQNVKDSSHANKYLRKIKINPWTKVEICISTYSNAGILCYSATCRTELNEHYYSAKLLIAARG